MGTKKIKYSVFVWYFGKYTKKIHTHKIVWYNYKYNPDLYFLPGYEIGWYIFQNIQRYFFLFLCSNI